MVVMTVDEGTEPAAGAHNLRGVALARGGDAGHRAAGLSGVGSAWRDDLGQRLGEPSGLEGGHGQGGRLDLQAHRPWWAA